MPVSALIAQLDRASDCGSGPEVRLLLGADNEDNNFCRIVNPFQPDYVCPKR